MWDYSQTVSRLAPWYALVPRRYRLEGAFVAARTPEDCAEILQYIEVFDRGEAAVAVGYGMSFRTCRFKNARVSVHSPVWAAYKSINR